MIHIMRVLVAGATGRVGRAVVGSLTAAGVPMRALTRRPEAAVADMLLDAWAADHVTSFI
jgi:uncharacterized protein YbjT (DUF2867 family)